MKGSKKLLVMLLALIMVFTMASCGGSQDNGGEEPVPGEVKAEDLYCVVNGQEVRLGDVYEDIKAGLGEEAKPAEEVEPCDDTTDWLKTIHYYDGVSIHHNIDGIVEHIDINTYDVGEGDVSFMGKVKLGDSIEDIKTILGEPRQEDEWSIDYMIDNVYVMIMRTEEGADTIAQIDFHPEDVM